MIELTSGFASDEGLCTGCRTDLDPPGVRGAGEYFYMVTDELWARIGMADKPIQLLCIGCLEIRLGRELEADDFKPGSCVNWPQPQDTPRLAARKTKIVRPEGATLLSDLRKEYEQRVEPPVLVPPRWRSRLPKRLRRND